MEAVLQIEVNDVNECALAVIKLVHLRNTFDFPPAD